MAWVSESVDRTTPSIHRVVFSNSQIGMEELLVISSKLRGSWSCRIAVQRQWGKRFVTIDVSEYDRSSVEAVVVENSTLGLTVFDRC